MRADLFKVLQELAYARGALVAWMWLSLLCLVLVVVVVVVVRAWLQTCASCLFLAWLFWLAGVAEIAG